MCAKGELDKELTQFFFNHDIFKQYSKETLNSEQLDLEDA
jgi:hypothetical protein